ncbi:MAG: hypothetical protein PVG39_04640, partial [Desulfobacteraceae bacterium]
TMSAKDEAEITALLKKLGETDEFIKKELDTMKAHLKEAPQEYFDRLVEGHKRSLSKVVKVRKLHFEKADAIGTPENAVENGKMLKSVKKAVYDVNNDGVADIEIFFADGEIKKYRYLNDKGRAFCSFVSIGEEVKRLKE